MLQEAGQAKIFLPFIAKGYNFITGNTLIDNPQDVYDSYVKKNKIIIKCRGDILICWEIFR